MPAFNLKSKFNKTIFIVLLMFIFLIFFKFILIKSDDAGNISKIYAKIHNSNTSYLLPNKKSNDKTLVNSVVINYNGDVENYENNTYDVLFIVGGDTLVNDTLTWEEYCNFKLGSPHPNATIPITTGFTDR